MKRTFATQLILIFAIVQLNSIGWTQENGVSSRAVKFDESFEINFVGGSIAEYIAFLRTCPNYDSDLEPAPVNIVVTESTKNFQLPEIKVKTNMDGALGLLEGCSTDNSKIVVQPDPTGNVTMISVHSNEVPTVTVINAKQLLLNLPMEDLIEVIDVGLTMQGNSTKVELKLHEKTGLLFAKGTRSGTQLVLGIVDELSDKPNRGRMGMMGGMSGGGMGMDDYGDEFEDSDFGGMGGFGGAGPPINKRKSEKPPQGKSNR